MKMEGRKNVIATRDDATLHSFIISFLHFFNFSL
jgi:hypothetical protein